MNVYPSALIRTKLSHPKKILVTLLDMYSTVEVSLSQSGWYCEIVTWMIWMLKTRLFKVGLSHLPKKLCCLLHWKPFKRMKNTFYFILNVLKIFKFLSWLFGHTEKRFDLKDKVNFKIDDVTPWLTNNCNRYIGKYLTK